MGPPPSLGDPAHNYTSGLCARPIANPGRSRATREEVLAAIDVHVIAKGEVIGTYERPGKKSQSTDQLKVGASRPLLIWDRGPSSSANIAMGFR